MRGVAFQESAVFPVPSTVGKGRYSTASTVSIATWAPSNTNSPFTLRPLQVALRPQAQMVFISSMVWASSRRRVEPGKPRFIKSGPQPIADDRNVQVHRDQNSCSACAGVKNPLSSHSTQAGALPWAVAVSARTISRMSMSGLTTHPSCG